MALLRVYDLAKELGVDSRTIMWHLTALDAPVRSASSQLHPSAVRAVRERLAAGIAPRESSAHVVERLVARPSPVRDEDDRRAHVVERLVARPSSPVWDEDDKPDPNELLTARRAAREVRVVPATLRQWIARGHLERAGTNTAGHVLYRRCDVERAARETSARTRRTPPPARVAPVLMRRPVTALEAARMVGVSPSTIRMWVHRGHLRALYTTRPMRFDPMHVLQVARRRPR